MVQGKLMTFACVHCGMIHTAGEAPFILRDVYKPECMDLGHRESLICELKQVSPLRRDVCEVVIARLMEYDDDVFEITKFETREPAVGIIIHYIDLHGHELTYMERPR